MSDRILVTGGAGFVGASLAVRFKRDRADCDVIALDNLWRPGSELSLPRLADAGVTFVKGDVRNPEDIAAVGPLSLIIDCAAEPSVHAGYGAGDPKYLIDTNLNGTINVLEHLRRTGGDLVFLSTSRVYPIAGLRALPLRRVGERLEIEPGAQGPGWSAAGISEDFPLEGTRSLYGTTKLCSEMVIREYSQMYGLRAIIDRCGVISGPWQMGQVDQGFVALWMARHAFGGDLAYRGFGGTGEQVRDVVHVADLYDLLRLQLAEIETFAGRVFNVGGGGAVSTSLRELTARCRDITGNAIDIGRDPDTRDADIPYYVSDNQRITAAAGWTPRRTLDNILHDIHRWLIDNRAVLQPFFATRLRPGP